MTIEEVWRAYRQSLLKFLSSKISNQADVEDLLQDILIKTHQNLSALKNNDKLKPWLFQIANRSIIDFYRRQAKGIEQDHQTDFAEDYEESDLLQCLEPVIDCLPDKHASVLKAIDLDGMSQKLYAEKHQLSYSTLKSRVQKSRKELKRLFEQCCAIELNEHGIPAGCNNSMDHCASC